MAKVITLSQTFPSYHPKAGQRTYFVEQVLNALGIEWYDVGYLDLLHELNPQKPDLVWDFFCEILKTSDQPIQDEKPHTIRTFSIDKNTQETYSRWKQGDKASLRVWSGKPYNSPQIIIAPDVELKQVFDIKINCIGIITDSGDPADFLIKRESKIAPPVSWQKIASNDGLSIKDLKDWFKYPKPFEGQILAWKEVDYV